MPPQAKFSREEIIEAALSLIRAEGMENLTSRALGTRLGSSARPIFTVFQNMEEVQQAVMEAAREIYNEYVKKGLSEELAFKGVGKQYISLSINEPKLFQLLFMTEHGKAPSLSGVLPSIDENYEQILSSIQRPYGMEKHAAEKLYRHMWLYTHGIATLCATKMCSFTGEEISEMMTEVFVSLLKDEKAGERQ